ncbi:MAG TPA: tRNA preQ1(34) S-adenosylmethionine ribosyltransferase-isomerase QueA [Nitrospiria bacterium]|nr:tRNA preQ1(34) S-adenosylmethionine ribosyltransferase-isomerase QueA [Nitrospiria bacterium]
MITQTLPAEYRLSSYDYPLEEPLIAQAPLVDRDRARLMVLHRETGRIEHRRFSDLTDYLRPPDVLVVNDTRVIPARLQGRKIPGGGKVELLMLGEAAGLKQWEALVRGSVAVGQAIAFDGAETAVVRQNLGKGRKVLEWIGEEAVEATLNRLGAPPLPPYIRRSPGPEDRRRYQTVYAMAPGSVAAPTAGLHFTENLLDRIRARGVTVVSVTLHVGPGTFRPVRCEDIREHRMDSERFEIGPAAVEALEEARRKNGRIMAVGTTATRVLESAIGKNGRFQARSGRTDLFITPGFSFQAVDALVTNFHLPKSTLLMLVSAFAGLAQAKQAYAEALRVRYRFLSYGDAMLIV